MKKENLKHKKALQSKFYMCKYCGQLFTFKRGKKAHVEREHNATLDKFGV